MNAPARLNLRKIRNFFFIWSDTYQKLWIKNKGITFYSQPNYLRPILYWVNCIFVRKLTLTANSIQKVSFPLEHHFAFRGTTFSRDLPSFFDARILGKGIFRVYRQFLEADSSTAIVRLREPDSFHDRWDAISELLLKCLSQLQLIRADKTCSSHPAR